MTEHSYFISAALKTGLRPKETFLNKEGFLEACFNLVPTEGGLELYEDPVDPFLGGVAQSFPFPQVLLGRDHTLLAGSTTLHEVSTNVSPWTLSLLATRDPANPGTAKAVTPGGRWHFADLGPAWYATNGVCTVFKTGLGRLTGQSELVFVQDQVTISSIAEHKGRVWLGGLDKDDIWSSNFWQGLFTLYTSTVSTPFEVGPDGPDANWVMWSSIGGGDLPLWLFMPSGYTDLAPTADAVRGLVKRNQLGWMPMRWQGPVHMVKPLGDGAVVYGENGVTLLIPQGGLVGRREVLEGIGVLGRGAVGGDEQTHVFLDSNRVLWMLGEGRGPQRLGFEEFLFSLPASSTLIEMRHEPRQFYISSPSSNFVLVQSGDIWGLSEHKDRITSIPWLSGSFYALHSSIATTAVLLRSGSFNNKRAALKHIHDIQVHSQDLTDVRVSLFYRYESDKTFRQWGPVRANPQGIVYPMVTGLDFKIQVTAQPLQNGFPIVRDIEVRWNLVDLRAMRGLYSQEEGATFDGV